jgi:Uma2 family endonuclease
MEQETHSPKPKDYPRLEEEETGSVVKEPAIVYGRQNERRYSYADYLMWLDDKRREIIDGIVKLMSAPTTKHAIASSNLEYELMTHIRKHRGKCEVFHAPFDVCLPRNGETADHKIHTVVQPDILVICDLSKLDDKRCLGAPDLVVEIQSPSTAQYDLTVKFKAYEAAGVREYWVVFPETRGITVYCLQENGKFDKGTACRFEGKVTSQVLEGLEINLDDLFRE